MNLFAKSLRSSFFLDDFFRLAQASKKSHRVLNRSSLGFGFIVNLLNDHRISDLLPSTIRQEKKSFRSLNLLRATSPAVEVSNVSETLDLHNIVS